MSKNNFFHLKRLKRDFLKSNKFIFFLKVFLLRIEEMKLKKRFLKFKINLFLGVDKRKKTFLYCLQKIRKSNK